MTRKKPRSSREPSPAARPDGTFDVDSLSDAEKGRLYAECEAFDRPGVPLGPAQRRLHAEARGRGRPRKGKGSEIISLSVEKALLRRAERLAKRQGVSRSELFSRGLKAILAVAGAA